MQKRHSLFFQRWLRFFLFAVLAFWSARKLKAQNIPGKQWEKSFGGDFDDIPGIVIQTTDGGYAIGGYSFSGISGDKTEARRGGDDFWLIKLDSGGNKEWDKTLGGDSDDNLFTLQQTMDGGYIAGGQSNSRPSGDVSGDDNQGLRREYVTSTTYWVLKMDDKGKIVWDRTFGGKRREALYHIQQTKNGEYLLGGISTSEQGFDKSEPNKGEERTSDAWIIKLDASGNKLWDKTIGGDDSDIFYLINGTTDGGLILAGTSYSGKGGDRDFKNKGTKASNNADVWIVKLDGQAYIEWQKAIANKFIPNPVSILKTEDGGYLLGGWSEKHKKIKFVRLRNKINRLRRKINNNYYREIKQYKNIKKGYYIIKLNGEGRTLWKRNFREPFTTLATIALTSDNGYFLSGQTIKNIKGYDKHQTWVARLNAKGKKLWKTEVNNTFRHPVEIKATPDGGFILTGWFNKGLEHDIWVIKYGPDTIPDTK